MWPVRLAPVVPVPLPPTNWHLLIKCGQLTRGLVPYHVPNAVTACPVPMVWKFPVSLNFIMMPLCMMTPGQRGACTVDPTGSRKNSVLTGVLTVGNVWKPALRTSLSLNGLRKQRHCSGHRRNKFLLQETGHIVYLFQSQAILYVLFNLFLSDCPGSQCSKLDAKLIL